MKQTKKIMAFCFCLVTIAALLLTGCVEEIGSVEAPEFESGQHATVDESKEQANAEADDSAVVQLGEGERVLKLSVYGSDGMEKKFEIFTDQKTVGEALLEVGLIEGEDSEYGLYIKTVNGEPLDFEKDGKYWAFYIDDAYATTGVDSTEIDPAKSYSLKAES